jgi:hypothetical protein
MLKGTTFSFDFLSQFNRVTGTKTGTVSTNEGLFEKKNELISRKKHRSGFPKM